MRYSLSYRDLEEMMAARGLHVADTTLYCWVQRYAPELERRVRAQRKPTNDYFFRQARGGAHTVMPRVINVDRNAAYPPALAALHTEGPLAPQWQLRPGKYLKNIIEQDHRFIKRRVKPGLGCWSYQTAWRTLPGYEALNQLRKGQVRGTTKGDIGSQNRFIEAAFRPAA